MTIIRFSRPPSAGSMSVRVSDLRQWTYCPRVVWWTYMCPVGKLESVKMRHGLLKEERLQQLQRRRTLRSFRLDKGCVDYNVSLCSTRLNLSGRLDMLIRVGGRYYPVEIKFTRGDVRLNHRLQLAGYAALLEDVYGCDVEEGYVFRLPDEAIVRIRFDEPLRELVRNTLESIITTLSTEDMPPPSPVAARCVDCEYRLFCGDVDA